MNNSQILNAKITELLSQERKENKDNIDETLAAIKNICLTYDLRIGQLFENIRFLSQEKDLFNYSNKRLELTINDKFSEK